MCLTPDHDVLTTTGWKPIAQVTCDDLVYALKPDGSFGLEKPVRLYEYDCDNDELCNVESSYVSLTVTKTHKMWARPDNSSSFQLIEAIDLQGRNATYAKAAANTNKFQLILPAAGKIPECKPDMELFVEFYAALYDAEEVFIDPATGQTTITLDFRRTDNLIDLLQLLGYQPKLLDFNKVQVHDEQLSAFLSNTKPGNDLPEWVWQLNERHSQLLYNCIKNHSNRDELQRLALHAGYAAIIAPQGDLITHVVARPEVHHSQMTIVPYTGKVYCIEVPSHVFYVRKNGKGVWTGNSSRHGQKGVCGMIMPHEDMPFTKDGIIPDIIINPHAFPSRMTVGHLIECIMAKACAMKGCEYDAVPFETHDTESFYSELESKFGMNKTGDEILYNGRTGEQIATEIFIGPTYYQRLKHMVADKINYRTTGRVMGLTKQPTKGRSNEGGLRIGEMEANAILSHGLSAFIKESFFDRSDKYEFYLDREQNTIAGKNKLNKRIMSPYTLKLLIQELQTMSIDPRIITDTDFDAEAPEIFDDSLPTHDEEDDECDDGMCLF